MMRPWTLLWLALAAAVCLLLAAPAEAEEQSWADAPATRSYADYEAGASFALVGITGVFVADARPMGLAPASAAPSALADFAPVLDGSGSYLGSGLRAFYHGRYARAGLTGGLYLVDRGLTRQTGSLPPEVQVYGDVSWGGQVELFVGGQIDLRPLFPYLDVAGWLDIVQTRFDVYADEQGLIATPAYNEYAFGVGPRVGFVLPISDSIYLDLGARAGLIGMNRFGFTAGFGYTSGYLPSRPSSADIVTAYR